MAFGKGIGKRLNGFEIVFDTWCKGLPRVIRVKYEKRVFKPLEPLDLEEGEELVVFIRKHRVGEVLDKYIGLFGKASVEELRKYEEEAQAQ